MVLRYLQHYSFYRKTNLNKINKKNLLKVHLYKKKFVTLQSKTERGPSKALQSETASPGGGMVDALVSGASAARRAGSSPVLGTHINRK